MGIRVDAQLASPETCCTLSRTQLFVRGTVCRVEVVACWAGLRVWGERVCSCNKCVRLPLYFVVSSTPLATPDTGLSCGTCAWLMNSCIAMSDESAMF